MKSFTLAAASFVSLTLLGCGPDVDRVKLEAFLTAAGKQADQAVTDTAFMCDRRGLDSAKLTEGIQAIYAEQQEIDRATADALDSFLATKPPMAIEEKARDVMQAVANVSLSVAAVALSCDIGEPTESTPAANQNLKEAVRKFHEQAGALRASK